MAVNSSDSDSGSALQWQWQRSEMTVRCGALTFMTRSPISVYKGEGLLPASVRLLRYLFRVSMS